jgi:hypothetical protein
MISITTFSVTLMFSILAHANRISIPDPLILALFGAAILAIAGFIKKMSKK